MEIIFNKLTYIENKRSAREIVYLNDVSLVIEQGSIVGFLGDRLDIIGRLLLLLKRPSSGEIRLNNSIIKRSSHVDNVNAIRKNIGFVYSNYNKLFLEVSVLKEISNIMNNYNYKTDNVVKHVVQSLRIVGLDESFLDRDPNELSRVEKKKVELASVISYNPEVLVLDNFDIGLSYREKEYFRKLFLKLKNKYNKTIILISNNAEFLFDIVDDVHLIYKGKLVLSEGKDIFYNSNLYRYVNIPKIIEFTKYVEMNGYDIKKCTDIKELIKELYRNVG